MKLIDWLIYTLFTLTLVGCENSLDIAVPNSKIPSELAFADDAAANSAMIGVYIDMYKASSFSSGSNVSVTSLAGLSADELKNGPRNDRSYVDFEDNQINITNTLVLGLWSSMYKTIYEANAVLEGISRSTGLSEATRNQLRGEALFLRAFANLYLVNLFGDVPLVTSTDYTINAKISRHPISVVYDQIKVDLLNAENLLSDTYIGIERVRVNRWAATALLARVYLYTHDWARAEDKASNVISNTALFSLEANLNDVFLLDSREAIFQLKPADGSSRTFEGYYFGPTDGPKYNVLREALVTAFDDDDLRKTNWILALGSGSNITYLPSKYKKYLLNTPTNEYSMVLRLAELYLVRAEARAQQEKLATAIADIDIIRRRAELQLVGDMDVQIYKEDLLMLIEQERRFELFTEWGHRWMDLKRWGHATEALKQIKNNWANSDIFYPIPQSEIVKNSHLLPQNIGY